MPAATRSNSLAPPPSQRSFPPKLSSSMLVEATWFEVVLKSFFPRHSSAILMPGHYFASQRTYSKLSIVQEVSSDSLST